MRVELPFEDWVVGVFDPTVKDPWPPPAQAAVVGAAALLAGFGAFLYGGSRMVAAGER